MNKNTSYKALGLIILVSVMILFNSFFVSADFLSVKNYDAQNKEVTITNFLGLGSQIADVTLDTPIVNVVPMGYQEVAEFTLDTTSYTNALQKIDFYNENNQNSTIQDKQFDYKYKAVEQVPYTDYRTVWDNSTPDSQPQQIAYTDYYNETVWKDFDPSNVDEGIYTIGIFTDVGYGDKVEWIPTFYGKKISEWASYVQSSGTTSYYLNGSTNYTVVTYTSNGYFNVTGNMINLSVLVVGGGGGGAARGDCAAGGGGGGGVIYNGSFSQTGNFTVTVGVGGTGVYGGSATTYANNGTNSSFKNVNFSMIAYGGAGGTGNTFGQNGGSGGAGGCSSSTLGLSIQTGINGTSYGNSSGKDGGGTSCGGGGGGSGSLSGAGGNAFGSGSTGTSGFGGNGSIFDINGTQTCYAGGGGGGCYYDTAHSGLGGCGGGANGGYGHFGMTNATANTGGGGAGGGQYSNRSDGASGIVIVRYATLYYYTAPTVTQVTPVNYFNTTTSTVTFNVTAKDYNAGGGIANVSLYIDNVSSLTNTSGVNGSYIFTKVLSAGVHNWSVSTFNINGSSASSPNWIVNLSIDSPAITLNSPIMYYNTSNLVLTFNSTVTDGSLIRNVSLYIDNVLNQTNTTTGNGTYLFTASLGEGYHYWSILAYNALNNPSQSANSYFNITLTNPQVTLTSPTNYYNSSTPTITFNANVIDNYTIQNVSLYLDGNLNETKNNNNFSPLCYQESANVQNQTGIDGNCGLNYSGNFNYSGYPQSGFPIWQYSVNLVNDGDWNSYTYPSNAGQIYYIMINYTKPSNSFDAFWEVKDTQGQKITNLSIPSSCFNYNTNLILNITFNLIGGNNINYFQCYDGNWENLLTDNVGGAANFLYEEAMIWNISYSSFTKTVTEGLHNWSILAYNNFSKYSQSSTQFFWVNTTPSVTTLTAPVNNANLVYNNIKFNSTVNSVYNINNVSLYINGTLNQTDTSGTNGSYVFSQYLSDGYYNWNEIACSSLGACNQSGTNILTIDTITPFVNITNPLTGSSSYTNFTTVNSNTIFLNWTASDAHLSTCWYSKDGGITNTTVTCNTNQTLTLPFGSYTITAWASDTFGNLGSATTSFLVDFKIFENTLFYNPSSLSGTNEQFTYNFNKSANLLINNIIFLYNNVSYPVLFSQTVNFQNISNNLIVPSVNSPTNYKFYWSFTMSDGSVINSSYGTQTINPFVMDNCSSKTNVLVNFSMLDEETLLPVNGTIEALFNIYNLGTTNIIATYNNSFTYNTTLPNPVICIPVLATNYSLGYTIKHYVNASYFVRYRNVQSMTLSNQTLPINLTLYNLLSSDGTVFTLSVTGNAYSSNGNLLVAIQKNYIPTNNNATVESSITNGQGEAVAHLIPSNAIYNFIVSQNGVTLGIFNSYQVQCQNPPICSIPLNLNAATIKLQDYTNYGNIVGTTSLNNATNTLQFSFVSSDGNQHNVSMLVYTSNSNSNGYVTLCNSYTYALSGVLSCVIPAAYQNATILSQTYSDGTSLGTQTTTLYGSTGKPDYYGVDVLIEILMYTTLVLLMISNPVLIVIGSVLGMVFAIALIFIGTTNWYTLLGVIIYFIVAGILVAYQINRRK